MWHAPDAKNTRSGRAHRRTGSSLVPGRRTYISSILPNLTDNSRCRLAQNVRARTGSQRTPELVGWVSAERVTQHPAATTEALGYAAETRLTQPTHVVHRSIPGMFHRCASGKVVRPLRHPGPAIEIRAVCRKLEGQGEPHHPARLQERVRRSVCGSP